MALQYTEGDEAVACLLLSLFSWIALFDMFICYLVLVSPHQFPAGFCLLGQHFAYRGLAYNEGLDSVKRKISQ